MNFQLAICINQSKNYQFHWKIYIIFRRIIENSKKDFRYTVFRNYYKFEKRYLYSLLRDCRNSKENLYSFFE